MLERKPALRRPAEGLREAQGHLRTDGARAQEDAIHSGRGNVELRGELTAADAVGLGYMALMNSPGWGGLCMVISGNPRSPDRGRVHLETRTSAASFRSPRSMARRRSCGMVVGGTGLLRPTADGLGPRNDVVGRETDSTALVVGATSGPTPSIDLVRDVVRPFLGITRRDIRTGPSRAPGRGCTRAAWGRSGRGSTGKPRLFHLGSNSRFSLSDAG